MYYEAFRYMQKEFLPRSFMLFVMTMNSSYGVGWPLPNLFGHLSSVCVMSAKPCVLYLLPSLVSFYQVISGLLSNFCCIFEWFEYHCAPSWFSPHLEPVLTFAEVCDWVILAIVGMEGTSLTSIPIQADDTMTQSPHPWPWPLLVLMAAIGDRMIHRVTDEEFEKTLAPKVRGSLEIFATAQQEEWSLDFFLVLFLGACRAWHNYVQVALQRTATPRPHHLHLHQFVHVQIKSN